MTTRPTEGTAVQKALGDIFRNVRNESGISLKALALRMKRSINTIRWHEAGSRSLRADDLVLAAQVIGCSPSALLTDDFGRVTQGGADEADAAAA